MKLANHRALAQKRVGGFTMLEVLISIVVIAFGMLGIAGLQAYALKNSQSASLRSIATVLASDLIDRMQANPVASTDSLYDEGGKGVAAALAPACLAGGCSSPSQLAGHDLAEWKASVTAALPNAQAIVCVDSSIDADSGKAAGDNSICDHTGNQYVIYIWWRDDRNKGATAASGRFATQFHI